MLQNTSSGPANLQFLLPLAKSESLSSRLAFWIWGWGFIVVMALTGPMVLAGFSIIDDHTQIAWFNDGLSASRLWSNFLHTEVGKLGSGGRFRPVFYAYLELEAWVLGDRAGIYHALRILYFGLFLGAAGWTAAHCIKPIFAAALVALIAGLSFWANLWCVSFGPAEQIASIGISLLLIAGVTIVSRLVADDPVPIWALPLASVGVAIAAGSKENFVFLLGALAVLVATLAMTRRLRPLSVLLALPPLIVPALGLYALVSASHNAKDFYGVDNSVAHRLAMLLQEPVFLLFAIGAVGFAGWLSLYAWRHSPLERQRLRRLILIFVGLISFLAAYILWEVFFYNGRLPSGTRYDFPVALLPLAIAIGCAGFVRAAALRCEGACQRVARGALIAFAAIYLLTFHLTLSMPYAAVRLVARSTEFRRDFLTARTMTAIHSEWPIVLEAGSPSDFEKVDSFGVWARFYDVSNPVMLRIVIPPRNIQATFDQWLADQMTGWGRDGVPGKFKPLPDPATLETFGQHCFVVGFGQPIVSPCARLPLRPARY